MSATWMSDVRMIRCAACGAMNRVPLEKIQSGLEPICGRCKTPLSLRPHPLAITDATFAEQVESSPLPVRPDVWPPWAGPCRMLTPVIEELAAELAGRMRIAKLNLDDNPVAAS